MSQFRNDCVSTLECILDLLLVNKRVLTCFDKVVLGIPQICAVMKSKGQRLPLARPPSELIFGRPFMQSTQIKYMEANMANIVKLSAMTTQILTARLHLSLEH